MGARAQDFHAPEATSEKGTARSRTVPKQRLRKFWLVIMTIHIASINGLNLLPNDYLRAKSRDGIVQQMAEHLVAGAIGGLDLTCDVDVVQYMLDAPERYGWKAIEQHIDAATLVAQQIIVTAEMVRA